MKVALAFGNPKKIIVPEEMDKVVVARSMRGALARAAPIFSSSLSAYTSSKSMVVAAVGDHAIAVIVEFLRLSPVVKAIVQARANAEIMLDQSPPELSNTPMSPSDVFKASEHISRANNSVRMTFTASNGSAMVIAAHLTTLPHVERATAATVFELWCFGSPIDPISEWSLDLQSCYSSVISPPESPSSPSLTFGRPRAVHSSPTPSPRLLSDFSHAVDVALKTPPRADNLWCENIQLRIMVEHMSAHLQGPCHCASPEILVVPSPEVSRSNEWSVIGIIVVLWTLLLIPSLKSAWLTPAYSNF